MRRAGVALFLAATLTSCATATPPTPSPTASPLAVAAPTSKPSPTITIPTPVPLATSTATTWAQICGTVSDYVNTTATADGSLVLNSPGRSPLKITLPRARINPEARIAGYICTQVDAGVPYPILGGLGMPRTESYIDPGTYPASNARPAPPGFVIPQSCAFARPPEVGTDQTSWWVDCGAQNNNARGVLGTALGQQGWTSCGPAAGTELFFKGAVRIIVVESSLAPGDYPKIGQEMRAATGCR